MDGRTFGLEPAEIADVIAEAELLLNVSGGTLIRDEYLPCKRKVLIDSDPGWNHFRNYPRWDANPNWQGSHGYRAHDHFFTYAGRIGQPGCKLPDVGLTWHPTVPPVVLDCWTAEPPGATWTTVMTWKNFQETIQHEGVTYGTKEMEFDSIRELPRYVSAPLELAIGGAQAPSDEWRALGWSVVSAQDKSRTAEDYRHYVQSSRGEISVAKNVYVATRSGWFSCRSTCYLAAGLPVVVQKTGFEDLIPTGAGILAFANLNEAASALESIESNYTFHTKAAQELARAHFASEVVLADILTRIGL
jgi:hypothetical protein